MEEKKERERRNRKDRSIFEYRGTFSEMEKSRSKVDTGKKNSTSKSCKKKPMRRAKTTTSANNQDLTLFILPSKVENIILIDEQVTGTGVLGQSSDLMTKLQYL